MKKLLIFTLIALFALSAFSCNTQPPQPSETTDGEITTDEITMGGELTTDETTTEAEVTTDGETTENDSQWLPPENIEILNQIYVFSHISNSKDTHINITPFIPDMIVDDSKPRAVILQLGDKIWHLDYQWTENNIPYQTSDWNLYFFQDDEGFVRLFDDGSIHSVTRNGLAKFDLSNISTLYDLIPLICTTFREWVDPSEFPFVEIRETSGEYEFVFSKAGGSYFAGKWSVVMNKEGVVTSFFRSIMWAIDSRSDYELDLTKENQLIRLAIAEINRVQRSPYQFFTFDVIYLNRQLVSINGEGLYIRYTSVPVVFWGEDGLYKEGFDIAIPLDLLLKENTAS